MNNAVRKYKTVSFVNIHDKTQACQFKVEVLGHTNIDLILKASQALKNPENWEFYEIRNHG